MTLEVLQRTFRPASLEAASLEGESLGERRLHQRGRYRSLARAGMLLLFVGCGLHLLLNGALGISADPLFGSHYAHFFGPLQSPLLGFVVASLAIVMPLLVLSSERRSWVRAAALCTSILGVLSVLAMVTWGSRFSVVSFSTLTQLLFASSALLSRAYSPRILNSDLIERGVSESWVSWAAVLFFFLAALQSLSGSFVRIADAGLALPTFPIVGEGLLPPLTDDGLDAVNRQRADLGLEATELSDVWLHFFHRVGGILLLCGAALLWWQTSGERLSARGSRLVKASRAALILTFLCLFEGLVGVLLLWSLLDPLALGFHMVMSAFILRQALSIALYARAGL